MAELIKLNDLGNFSILNSRQLPITDKKSDGSRLLVPINGQTGSKLYDRVKESYMLKSFSKCTVSYDEAAARRQIQNYNPVYTFDEEKNPSPIFDYGLIIPSCTISLARDYATIIDWLYPIETASGQPLPRPNRPSYTGLLVSINNAFQYDRVSQVNDYSEIEDYSGNKRYCGVKLDAVSAHGALPYSELKDGTLKIPTLITTPPLPIITCDFFFENYDSFHCNPILGIMRCKKLIYLPLRVTKWEESENRNITTDIDYPVTIYMSARFYSSIPSFSVTNSFISDDAINEETYTSGTVISQPIYYRATLQSFRDEWKVLFLYTGQGGTCIANIEGVGDKLTKQVYSTTALPRSAPLINFIFAISELGEFYPLNYPYWLGSDAEFYPPAPMPREGISIPKINAEFFYPTVETGDVYLIHEDSNNFAFSSYGYGAYTVLFNSNYFGSSELNNFIYFILRDGGGFYKVDISEVIGNKKLTYGGYDDGFVLLGLTDDSDVITYVMLEVDIPRPVSGKVAYDFKKIGVAFMPCMTHCMGQGGIYSKY